jgi:hypothetical protein
MYTYVVSRFDLQVAQRGPRYWAEQVLAQLRRAGSAQVRRHVAFRRRTGEWDRLECEDAETPVRAQKRHALEAELGPQIGNAIPVVHFDAMPGIGFAKLMERIVASTALVVHTAAPSRTCAKQASFRPMSFALNATMAPDQIRCQPWRCPINDRSPNSAASAAKGTRTFGRRRTPLRPVRDWHPA